MKYLLKIAAGAITALTVTAVNAADPMALPTSTRYDVEYPTVAYSEPARDNRVARLQQKLDSGALKLTWEPRFGYLRSLLKALEIDIDSQVLVFSRTSLQIEHISPAKPRAVYFNDDTYVGFVQDSPLIEITAIDTDKGAVFYGFENHTDYPPSFTREGGRCLTCHDTYSMSGGGVPRVMVLSSPVDDPSDERRITAGEDVDDRTPFATRWGGWYVTGNMGKRTHLGNLPLREGRGGEKLRELRAASHNIDSVKQYLDTARYPSDQSDVVALTVLEHQTRMHNLITRVDYKIRTVLARDGGEAPPAGAVPRSWADVSPHDHGRLKQVMEPLVRALFLEGTAPFEDRMTGGSGFAERFSQLGPKDSQGRSLRQLDLQTRLFRHPFSFAIYWPQFDSLPDYALDYVYGRIIDVLQGKDAELSALLTDEQRETITRILSETKPAFAARLKAAGARTSRS